MAQAGIIAASPKLIIDALLPVERPKVSIESTAKGYGDFKKGGVLTHEMLEEAYHKATFGYDEPDLIIMSLRHYKVLTKILSNSRYSEGFHISEIGQWPKSHSAHVR